MNGFPCRILGQISFSVDETGRVEERRITPRDLLAPAKEAAELLPATGEIRLFGSLARGEATIDSDIDIVVVLDERVPDPLAIRAAIARVFRKLGRGVDVLVLTREDMERRACEDATSLEAAVRRDGVTLARRGLP